MNIQKWLKNTGEFGKILYRIRGYTPYPLVLLFIFMAVPTPMSLLAGLPLVLLGEMVRIWSVAYAGPETRETEIRTPRLITTGPYRFVRNPIYLGNCTIYTGVTLAANLWLPWLLPAVWLFFGTQYHFIVAAEEARLRASFGSTYAAYQQAVPRWLPGWPKFSGENPAPNLAGALRSETSTFLSIAGILAVLLLRMWLR